MSNGQEWRQHWPQLSWLLALYFVQGVPFGYQTLVLPIQLRSLGLSLTTISLSAAVSLPWSIKFLWSPMVDSYGGPGKRKVWIVPLLAGLCVVQLSFAAFLLATNGIDTGNTTESMEMALASLFGAMFLMNMLSATQDIAVDGLAIDLLEENELGIGNTAQVVGFKLGMFAGGPGLRIITGERLPATFLAFAGITAAVLLVTVLSKESKLHKRPKEVTASDGGFWKTTALLAQAVWSRRGALLVLAFVATYKAGEQISDTLFKPFVVDAYSSETALWLSTYSLVPSMLGSVLGGVLVASHGILRTLSGCCIARTVSIVFEWAIVMSWMGDSLVALLSTSWMENISGGALTTVTFAFMMAAVDKSVAASHYTLLAAVEVFGKLLFGQIAGPLADGGGYALAFSVACILSMAHLLFVPFLSFSLPSHLKAESLSD